MRDGFRIVDTDSHQMEPGTIWQEYIDAPFRDRAPRVEEFAGRRRLGVEGESVVSETKYPFSTPEFLQALQRGMERF